jgi:transcriptional regulator with GAF, ATPase, and Fis domain
VVANEHVAEALGELAGTLVDDFDVGEFLKLVTSHSAWMSDAAVAGLLLADPRGQLRYIAASAESKNLVELFQLQNHDGPSLECVRLGTPIVNTDLTKAQHRWPQFAPRAVSAGFRSVHAFPLRHRRQVIGALNLLSTNTNLLEPGEVRTSQALADLATLGLLQQHHFRGREELATTLQSAVNSRVTLGQATGVVARRYGLSVDAALALIRRSAHRHQLLLSEAALIIISGPPDYPRWWESEALIGDQSMTIRPHPLPKQ